MSLVAQLSSLRGEVDDLRSELSSAIAARDTAVRRADSLAGEAEQSAAAASALQAQLAEATRVNEEKSTAQHAASQAEATCRRRAEDAERAGAEAQARARDAASTAAAAEAEARRYESQAAAAVTAARAADERAAAAERQLDAVRAELGRLGVAAEEERTTAAQLAARLKDADRRLADEGMRSTAAEQRAAALAAEVDVLRVSIAQRDEAALATSAMEAEFSNALQSRRAAEDALRVAEMELESMRRENADAAAQLAELRGAVRDSEVRIAELQSTLPAEVVEELNRSATRVRSLEAIVTQLKRSNEELGRAAEEWEGKAHAAHVETLRVRTAASPAGATSSTHARGGHYSASASPSGGGGGGGGASHTAVNLKEALAGKDATIASLRHELDRLREENAALVSELNVYRRVDVYSLTFHKQLRQQRAAGSSAGRVPIGDGALDSVGAAAAPASTFSHRGPVARAADAALAAFDDSSPPPRRSFAASHATRGGLDGGSFDASRSPPRSRGPTATSTAHANFTSTLAPPQSPGSLAARRGGGVGGGEEAGFGAAGTTGTASVTLRALERYRRAVGGGSGGGDGDGAVGSGSGLGGFASGLTAAPRRDGSGGGGGGGLGSGMSGYF